MGSIPGWGTGILHAVWQDKKKKKKRIKVKHLFKMGKRVNRHEKKAYGWQVAPEKMFSIM